VTAVERVLPPAWSWARAVTYAQAVRVGDLILTCGVAPFDDTGALVGPGDVDAQARQVVSNLDTLLRTAGSGLGGIVRQHVYLRRAEDVPRFQRLRGELYRPPYPASVLVVVGALAEEEMLVEIAAEAVPVGARASRPAGEEGTRWASRRSRGSRAPRPGRDWPGCGPFWTDT
jgi:enamine deaminase RidA (YjgF/YER057c/UK114 family)